MNKLKKSFFSSFLLTCLLAGLALFAVSCSDDPYPSQPMPASANVATALPIPSPTPKPAEDVWAIMQFLNDRNNKSKFAPYVVDKNGGVTATFYRGETRYTIYMSGKFENNIWPTKNVGLSFWVGSKTKPRENFSCNFTGKARFGIITDKSVKDDRLFRDDTLEGGTVIKGEGNREYWQDELNGAITATLSQIGREDLIPPPLF